MTPPAFMFRSRARQDLVEQYLYLEDEAGVEVAERYYAAIEETFNRLVRYPLSGSPCDFAVTRLGGLHRAPVAGFPAYLIFYLPRAEGVEIVRVLHGARDIGSLLQQDER
jgi:toxin ParE1/3/4